MELPSVKKQNKKNIIIISLLAVILIVIFFASCFIGSSKMSFIDCLKAIFHRGEETNIAIIWNIRFPRLIAGLLCGIGLSIAGTIMQTVCNNPMASPTTLGTSNAAVLGANIAIIILGGGKITISGNNINISNPYFVSGIAFIFALLSTLLILFITSFKKFNSTTVVLIGIAIGTLCNGITTLIQYFASDTSLSSAVYWSFGDLGRASYSDDLILFIVIITSLVVFLILSFRYNALLFGDYSSSSIGINVKLLRFISLFLCSLITATCVSLLGIIGFIGIIAPQIMKRIVGNNHIYLLIGSSLLGAIILLISDIIAKVFLNGLSLPVGAITSILGAPFLIYILLTNRKEKL